MKKATEIKYPSSANLFNFCRRVLDHKFGGIRVIDQDVGQILGFDPADCSHWKKGKKNIRSIQAMKSIAQHLGVDEKLVVDLAAGEIDDTEAYHEYHGYGAFEIDEKAFETAKKDFYKKHAATWTREKEQEFKGYFVTNSTRIAEIVAAIHAKINFAEAPLYLPEVAVGYPNIKLSAIDAAQTGDEEVAVTSAQVGDHFEIKYPAGRETRAYMRFRVAKELGRYFLKLNGLIPPKEIDDYVKHITDVQSNIFAAELLTPAHLIRKEMTQLNVAKDIITQLAETFWVSKTFMNARLKEILAR